MYAVLDQLWNLRFIKGHRTIVARVCLQATAAILAYQGLATSSELIQAGIDLPDLTARVLVLLAGLSSYFGTKIAQFSKEHA